MFMVSVEWRAKTGEISLEPRERIGSVPNRMYRFNLVANPLSLSTDGTCTFIVSDTRTS